MDRNKAPGDQEIITGTGNKDKGWSAYKIRVNGYIRGKGIK